MEFWTAKTRRQVMPYLAESWAYLLQKRFFGFKKAETQGQFFPARFDRTVSLSFRFPQAQICSVFSQVRCFGLLHFGWSKTNFQSSNP